MPNLHLQLTATSSAGNSSTWTARGSALGSTRSQDVKLGKNSGTLITDMDLGWYPTEWNKTAREVSQVFEAHLE
jgi:hypothetical protein